MFFSSCDRVFNHRFFPRVKDLHSIAKEGDSVLSRVLVKKYCLRINVQEDFRLCTTLASIGTYSDDHQVRLELLFPFLKERVLQRLKNA